MERPPTAPHRTAHLCLSPPEFRARSSDLASLYASSKSKSRRRKAADGAAEAAGDGGDAGNGGGGGGAMGGRAALDVSGDDGAGGALGAGEEGDGQSREELVQQKKSLLMKLFRESGRSKIGAVKRHVAMLLDEYHGKFIIFAHHRAVLDTLANETLRGVNTIRIDGTTMPKDRQARVIKFQKDPAVRVALLGITAAGIALTLTAASRVIFAELYWTPAALLQAEDRVHRIGQRDTVQARHRRGGGGAEIDRRWGVSHAAFCPAQCCCW